tara:strand:+ start:1066 stop:1293 length:228 start_codon:yes stop_codon:yes gene_type:complete
MTTDKELKEIYNFYKDCKEGFVTRDGYAAVPLMGSKSLVVVYNGEQLKVCKTEKSAHTFIKKHRTQIKKGTVFVS